MEPSTTSSATTATGRIVYASGECRTGSVRPRPFAPLAALAALVIGAVLVAGVGGLAPLPRPSRTLERPRSVFVNGTGAHDHELALDMSPKLARRRSCRENALVVRPRVP